MLRQSTDTGDAFYGAFVTAGNGIAVQYRTTIGANAAMVANISGVVPQYLQVSKSVLTPSLHIHRQMGLPGPLFQVQPSP